MVEAGADVESDVDVMVESGVNAGVASGVDAGVASDVDADVVSGVDVGVEIGAGFDGVLAGFEAGTNADPGAFSRYHAAANPWIPFASLTRTH